MKPQINIKSSLLPLLNIVVKIKLNFIYMNSYRNV